MNRYKERVNRRLRDNPEVRRLTGEELEAIHSRCLQMMKEICECCRENGITAGLAYGSALGAVRHQGFIPWDDDMDLYITRQGFEKLKKIFRDRFGDRYMLHAPNYLSGNKARVGRIEDPGARIEDYTGCVHGVQIDVFVLENIPDNPLLYYLHGFRSLLYTAAAGLVIDYEYAREDRKAHGGRGRKPVSAEQRLRRFIGWCLSFHSAEKWLNRLDKVNRYASEKTRRVGIPTGRDHYFGEIWQREDMTRTEPMLFEGHEFPVPAGYDRYLRGLYGDYTVIPPEEEREYHYIRSINFEERQP